MEERYKNWNEFRRNWALGYPFEKQPACWTNHQTVSHRLAKVADHIEKWEIASPYRIR